MNQFPSQSTVSILFRLLSLTKWAFPITLAAAGLLAISIASGVVAPQSIFLDLDTPGVVPVNPGLIVYGNQATTSSKFGYSISHGHFNDVHEAGQPVEDMLVTAPFADALGRANNGVAYLILGGTDLPDVVDTDLNTGDRHPDLTIYGKENDRLGYDYSNVNHGGDVNGDSFDDIVVGLYSGAVYVIYGRSTLGIAADQTTLCNTGDQSAFNPDTGFGCVVDLASVEPQYDVVIKGESPNDQFGRVATGDVTGDGVSDLVLGAPFATSAAGKVYVIKGSGSLPQTIDLASPSPPDDLVFTITGNSPSDRLGTSISIRNVDGSPDGIADIVVGAPYADLLAAGNEGAVYVISGRESWLDPEMFISDGDADYTFYGEASNDAFGNDIYTGDMNGDSTSDIIVGARLAHNGFGTAYVFLGGSGLTGGGSASATTATLRVYGPSSGDAADPAGGVRVHFGKLNNDSYDDVILGFLKSTRSGVPTGRTFIIRGSSTLSGVIDLAAVVDSGSGCVSGGISSSTVYTICGDKTHSQGAADFLGAWVAAADVNGDGISEVLTSAWNADGPPNGNGNGTRPDVGEVYAIIDPDLDGWVSATEEDLGTDPMDACADSTTVFNERGPAHNNEPLSPWPPDFNDNGVVNGADYNLLVMAVNGTPHWLLPDLERYDLNGDGLRNQADLNIELLWQGKACVVGAP